MATFSAARTNDPSRRGLTSLTLIGCCRPPRRPSSTNRPIARRPSCSSAQRSSRTVAPARRQDATRYGCGAVPSLVTHKIASRRLDRRMPAPIPARSPVPPSPALPVEHSIAGGSAEPSEVFGGDRDPQPAVTSRADEIGKPGRQPGGAPERATQRAPPVVSCLVHGGVVIAGEVVVAEVFAVT